jgi:hypothetical protein
VSVTFVSAYARTVSVTVTRAGQLHLLRTVGLRRPRRARPLERGALLRQDGIVRLRRTACAVVVVLASSLIGTGVDAAPASASSVALPIGTFFCGGDGVPQQPVQWLCHTVQPGEWLWKIARDETYPPVTPDRIARVARFIYTLSRSRIGPNPNMLRPGMTLLVGFNLAPSCPPSRTNPDGTVTIIACLARK